MGEAYIVRRAGGSGTSGGPQVFLQSTEPHYENGGLWVDTELEKYATITDIKTGLEVGQALTTQIPTGLGKVYFKTVCGNWIYAITGSSGSSRTGRITGLNLDTMETRTSNSFYIERDEWIQSMYLVSNGGDMVVALAGSSAASDDRDWHVYTPSTGAISTISDANTGGQWNKIYSCCPFPSDTFACVKTPRSNSAGNRGIYSFSTTVYTQIGTYPQSNISGAWNITGYDENTFFRYINNAGATTYIVQIDASSGIETNLYKISNGKWYCYGRYSNNLYFYNGTNSTMYIINISSLTETQSFTSAYGDDNWGASQAFYNNKFYVANPSVVYPIEILGDYASDTVYIQTTGTENLATIAKDDAGTFNVPIERVVTFPEGSPIDATAYVSTGEAWIQI